MAILRTVTWPSVLYPELSHKWEPCAVEGMLLFSLLTSDLNAVPRDPELSYPGCSAHRAEMMQTIQDL